MQLRWPAALALFLGSYLPLSVILLVQNVRIEAFDRSLCLPWRPDCELPLKQPVLSIVLVTICIACLVLMLVVLRLLEPRRTIEVLESKHVPADLMNYVLPYVVSFMGLDFADRSKLAGFMVFLIWIFVITYRSGRIAMNPVLVVFGWRLFEIKYQVPAGSVTPTAFALSRLADPLTQGSVYKMHSMQDVMIIR